ncbi:flagellar hook-length control protein FliK [Dongia rigui]|uniref:Flagellar hook-length control protein FliK n=1 Tax=Dongia rigui TaxID=940149 RepID=A0ABU5DT82_9PROT|nr:flagellar hook-length control protein FliK [Dongia rigui]MDY0870557.1 flagellar hook-length control protein FliK [Dongia rigui]
METNRIDLAFALASKNTQVKSANGGSGSAFADMLLGATTQKMGSFGIGQSQVKPTETYTPRRRFDDYTTSQFDAHSGASSHIDHRVDNSQSRSRWSVDDASVNPGRGPQDRSEHVVHQGRAVQSQNGGEAQPADALEVGTDGGVDPVTETEVTEEDRDAMIGGDECGTGDSDQDTTQSDTPVISSAAPMPLPEEMPATTELEPAAVAPAAAGSAEPAGKVAESEASPEEIAAAAVATATSALPEGAATTAEPASDGIEADLDKSEKDTGDAPAKQGITFSATLALTDTADDMAAEAESQANAITGRNEQQLEDAGSSFRRNNANARRNQGNGAGATGAQATTVHQAAAAVAATEAHAASTATQGTASAASGVAPLGFDTGLGNAAGLPGWNVHLAQGSAIRRGDFVANLRQHLQNLPAHEQVALSIQRSLKDGGGNITLQLSPAELGRIHLKLKIDEENNVQASVTVERPATLELLQRDMKALERALQEAGLKAGPGDLSFSLQGGDPEAFAREFGSGSGSGPNGSARGAGSDGAEDAPGAVAAAIVDTADGWVDVQV